MLIQQANQSRALELLPPPTKDSSVSVITSVRYWSGDPRREAIAHWPASVYDDAPMRYVSPGGLYPEHGSPWQDTVVRLRRGQDGQYRVAGLVYDLISVELLVSPFHQETLRGGPVQVWYTTLGESLDGVREAELDVGEPHARVGFWLKPCDLDTPSRPLVAEPMAVAFLQAGNERWHAMQTVTIAHEVPLAAVDPVGTEGQSGVS